MSAGTNGKQAIRMECFPAAAAFQAFHALTACLLLVVVVVAAGICNTILWYPSPLLLVL
jgi:hypothetical protein